MTRHIKKYRRRKICSGSLSIEMMVAVVIMGILLGVLATLGNSFKKVHDHRWMKHILLAAGQSQMDAIVVTGKPIDEKKFEQLWPKVKCTIEIGKGREQWEGLDKVQFHLSGKCRGTIIQTSLIRYIHLNKELQE